MPLRPSTACFWEQERGYGWSYLSNDNLSSLAVDVECQMAKFLAKTLRVCSGLVVLTYLGTEAVVAAVTGVVSFNNQNKH